MERTLNPIVRRLIAPITVVACSCAARPDWEWNVAGPVRGLSLTQINDTLDNINRNFDNGTSNSGYLRR